jgi:hypothetical protein
MRSPLALKQGNTEEWRQYQTSLLQRNGYRNKGQKAETYPGLGSTYKNIFSIFNDTYQMIRHMEIFRAVNTREV